MNNYIAVFTRDEREFKYMSFYPTEMFIRIRNIDSLRGKKFVGVIHVGSWYESKSASEAYEFLRIRQPELYK